MCNDTGTVTIIMPLAHAMALRVPKEGLLCLPQRTLGLPGAGLMTGTMLYWPDTDTVSRPLDNPCVSPMD